MTVPPDGSALPASQLSGTSPAVSLVLGSPVGSLLFAAWTQELGRHVTIPERREVVESSGTSWAQTVLLDVGELVTTR